MGLASAWHLEKTFITAFWPGDMTRQSNHVKKNLPLWQSHSFRNPGIQEPMSGPVYSLEPSPPDLVTPRLHLQMPSVWLWGIMFASHEWILGRTQTRADSLLLVIFKVCGTPCPLLRYALPQQVPPFCRQPLSGDPHPPHIYSSARAPTWSSLRFSLVFQQSFMFLT